MRLFAAVDLSDEARLALAAAQAAFAADLGQSQNSGLRLVRAELMHLTLAFIGTASPAVAETLTGVMQAPLALAPFRIEFAGLGTFPEHGAPRVLWLGVTTGHAALMQVQAAVATRLAGVGVGIEGRPFHPHLTLARWRDRGDRRAALAGAAAALQQVAIPSVEVTSVTLFNSQLSPRGPRYTVLSRAPLIGPASLH